MEWVQDFKRYSVALFRLLRRKVDFVVLIFFLMYIVYILSQSESRNQSTEFEEIAKQIRDSESERLERFKQEVKEAVLAREKISTPSTVSPSQTTPQAPVEPKKRFPQCLVIGVQKGGARVLTMFLQTHPQILAAIGQINYFNLKENYVRGPNWYLKKMPATRPDQVTIERSVGYFYSEKAPERVHEMNSSIKLIVVVRDPIMRALSEYADLKSRNPSYPPFERLIIDKEKGWINENFYISQNSNYHIYLQKWLKFFPLDQFLFVEGDELAESPLAVLHRVENFIGVKNYISAANLHLNETVSPYYCAKQLQPIERIQCALHNKGWEAPNINPKVMKVLQNYYRKSVEEFERMSQQKFNWA